MRDFKVMLREEGKRKAEEVGGKRKKKKKGEKSHFLFFDFYYYYYYYYYYLFFFFYSGKKAEVKKENIWLGEIMRRKEEKRNVEEGEKKGKADFPFFFGLFWFALFCWRKKKDKHGN